MTSSAVERPRLREDIADARFRCLMTELEEASEPSQIEPSGAGQGSAKTPVAAGSSARAGRVPPRWL
jgi:hypothetical protein